MKGVVIALLALVAVSGCRHRERSMPATPWSISAMVRGHTLTMASSAKFAGAISSLTWNGKEFINSDDHGRELQSSVSFDSLGECYNPTEAGSETDGSGELSTSKLLYFSASGNALKSSAQMAFWTSANAYYPMGCGGDSSITEAQNTTNISTVTLTKQVTIGYQGIDNAIEFLVTFHVPEHHRMTTFESLTGYLGNEFSKFRTYDLVTHTVDSLSPGPGEQSKPVILSTVDNQYAMGIYSPDLPQPTRPHAGYGRFRFDFAHTMKWNAVFRMGDTPPGDYSFRLYVLVGTTADVVSGIAEVDKKFHP